MVKRVFFVCLSILFFAGCGPKYYPGLYHSAVPVLAPPVSDSISNFVALDFTRSAQTEESRVGEWSAEQKISLLRANFLYSKPSFESSIFGGQVMFGASVYCGENKIRSSYSSESSGYFMFGGLGIQDAMNFHAHLGPFYPGIGAYCFLGAEGGPYVSEYIDDYWIPLLKMTIYPFICFRPFQRTVFLLQLDIPVLTIPEPMEKLDITAAAYTHWMTDCGLWISLGWLNNEGDYRTLRLLSVSGGASISLPIGSEGSKAREKQVQGDFED